MNEEEKKVINIFIEKCNKYDESVEIKGISVGEEYRMLDTVCKALNLIEKLQKENKELEEINNELEAEKNEAIRRYNFETIPIRKIKDKIEEINKKILNAPKYDEKISVYRYQKQILQELIEEREEK